MDMDDELQRLLDESYGREIVVNHDVPDVKCPNCDVSIFDASNWKRDAEDETKILCARCDTHIMTQVNEDAKIIEALQAMVYKIDSEGLEYFLKNYIDMVPRIRIDENDPSGRDLYDVATNAIEVLEAFEEVVTRICAEHGIDYVD